MTARQKFLQLIYPFFVGFKKLTGKKNLVNKQHIRGSIPFHSLSVQLNNGQFYSFQELKGKKVLLVNTASDCGFTPQYSELQKLYQQENEKLAIIGFPANDFKQQEKGSDEQIGQFCKDNFGITFLLVKKSTVVRKPGQHPVFDWLTDREKNGWTSQQPTWNFSKYLIDENGILTHYFDPSASPVGTEIMNAITYKKNI